MDERALFGELLQDLVEQAQINGNRISQAEIQEYFEELQLSEEQFDHIYAYLMAHRITISGFVPGAETEKNSRRYQTFGELDQAREEIRQSGKPQSAGAESGSTSGTAGKKSAVRKGKAEKTNQKMVPEEDGSLEENRAPEPDSTFLKMYLRELRAKERLTKAQERELAGQILRLASAMVADPSERRSASLKMDAAKGQPFNQADSFRVDTVVDEYLAELKERFVHHKLRDVVKHARTYAEGGELLDELVQEGNIGLLTALQSLEQHEEAGAFLAYVDEQITQAMETYLDNAYASDGEAQAMVAKVHFISEAAKKMKEENGQEPTLAELAAVTNLTEEELLAIVNLSPDNLKA